MLLFVCKRGITTANLTFQLTHPVKIILWTESPPDTLNYPLSYGVPVRERYGFTLLPATREQHDQNCTQSH